MAVFVDEILPRIALTMDRGVGSTCFGIESLAKPHFVCERPMSKMMCACNESRIEFKRQILKQCPCIMQSECTYLVDSLVDIQVETGFNH